MSYDITKSEMNIIQIKTLHCTNVRLYNIKHHCRLTELRLISFRMIYLQEPMNGYELYDISL